MRCAHQLQHSEMQVQVRIQLPGCLLGLQVHRPRCPRAAAFNCNPPTHGQFMSCHKIVRIRLMYQSTDGSSTWWTWASDGLHLALGQSGAFHSTEGPEARPPRHSAAAAEAATAVRGRLRAWLTLQHTSALEPSASVRCRCHRASSKRGRTHVVAVSFCGSPIAESALGMDPSKRVHVCSPSAMHGKQNQHRCPGCNITRNLKRSYRTPRIRPCWGMACGGCPAHPAWGSTPNPAAWTTAVAAALAGA